MKMWWTILAVMLGLCSTQVNALGLSTPFVDVVMQEMPLGSTQSITDHGREGIKVTNLGGSMLHVKVDVLRPVTTQLRDGAKPIPDVRWLEIKPRQFDLPGKASITLAATLNVPADKNYEHKYYQAMIWIRGTRAEDSGIVLGAGLMPRLRFKTSHL